MEGLIGSGFDVANSAKKKRSKMTRRPRPDAPMFFDYRDRSPSSSTPPSDTVGRGSSDENLGYNNNNASHKRKEVNLNGSTWKVSSVNRKDDGAYGASRGDSKHGSDIRRCSEGALAPANWKSSSKVKDGSDLLSRKHGGSNGNGRSGDSSSGMGNTLSGENKLRKVKLKVGGVTRTIHAKSASDNANDGSHSKPSRSSDAPRQRQKLIPQDNSDDEHSPQDQAHAWRPSQKLKEDSRGRMTDAHSGGGTLEPVRKSKRVPKKRMLDGDYDDADEDDEIRYLERLKTAKAGVGYGSEYGNGDENSKKRKTLKVSKRKDYDDDDGEEYGPSRSRDGKKKSRSDREFEDGDYFEEDDDDDMVSDAGFDMKRKKQKNVDSLMDGKKEISLTTRQRALQSGRDASGGANASLIEFPNGLPPAPPRKQKEKLSEMELQLKKAEAAQRRKMQNEKAALESQREAIRKILGQDSNRKKKEDQMRKRREERAQEKAANANMLASNVVKWVIGPTGTTVTFPNELGLPSIFDQKPCSYPPPREKCAGPSCTNAYKYRDSKSKLPLCSLQCYRAIHETTQPVTTC